MSNMPHCRFEDAYSDLADCYSHMFDDNLSEEEKKYRYFLLRLCRPMVADWNDATGTMEIHVR